MNVSKIIGSATSPFKEMVSTEEEKVLEADEAKENEDKKLVVKINIDKDKEKENLINSTEERITEV